MMRRWLIASALFLWILGLGLLLQPHRNRPPRILHARLLQVGVRDLPTLEPYKP